MASTVRAHVSSPLLTSLFPEKTTDYKPLSEPVCLKRVNCTAALRNWKILKKIHSPLTTSCPPATYPQALAIPLHDS